MDESKIDGLSVYASGVFPVELSAGKRVNARHRVPVRATVDGSTGEVRFYVGQAAIDALRPTASPGK